MTKEQLQEKIEALAEECKTEHQLEASVLYFLSSSIAGEYTKDLALFSHVVFDRNLPELEAKSKEYGESLTPE